ncbi:MULTISPECIES: histidine phosphatase family protein [Paenibacillus]|uniref:Histidine phosphatase family protein n=1 Tax=Paenibacillus campinasensis TaxID=66347 RepID=A0ABW9SYS6_9BACL|nr:MULTISPECIES: histidine phosphatase family protein [Paenibacillus]MUG66014.1 histidine phosphatase family protein [Paenibacillus campinasensis]PAK49779.1 hypothetical protein CHH75_19565 [Paenibacillus sp. 7541]
MAVSVVVHLLRHGRTRWNEQRRYMGHTDQLLAPGALTELEPLRRRYHRHDFGKIYCSDLSRCRQTLGYVLSATGADQDPALIPAKLGETVPGVCYDVRLRELDFGQWEGKTYDDLKENPAYRSWIDDPSSVTPPGGESWEAFQQRIGQFLNNLYLELDEMAGAAESEALEGGHGKRPEAACGPSDVLIVTHGGVIRQMMTQLVDGVKFWALPLEPGEALRVRLTRSSAGWRGERLP